MPRKATKSSTSRPAASKPSRATKDTDLAIESLVEARLADRKRLEAEEQAARRQDRVLLAAHLPNRSAAVEDIYGLPAARGIDPAHLANLARCEWLTKKQNLIVTGGASRGKTWLGCALSVSAIRRAHDVSFWDVPALLRAWDKARDAGAEEELLETLQKVDLLVLDDWAVEPLRFESMLDLRRILLARLGAKSVMVLTPHPVEKWRDWLLDEYIADSLINRLRHYAQHVNLKGPSLMQPEGGLGK